jgi:hypothetical protein
MFISHNDAEPEDLGNGVVLFRNAISCDWDKVYDTVSNLVDEEFSEMYTETVDPETGEVAYENRSGYIFGLDTYMSMPRRGSSLHLNPSDEVRNLLKELEAAKDRCLLKYFTRYPLAYNCVWWKVKGHVVSYGDGVYLGSHSDISAEYIYGVHRTPQELALRSVVSTVTYLNSSVDADDLNGRNFTQGLHNFNYLKDVGTITPERGSILFFPSNFVAGHEVLPVGKGRRLSYLGWYSQGTPNSEVREDVCDPLLNPEGAENSTNVWMPTLREDYRTYLEEAGFDKSSEQYRVTLINSEG